MKPHIECAEYAAFVLRLLADDFQSFVNEDKKFAQKNNITRNKLILTNISAWEAAASRTREMAELVEEAAAIDGEKT